MKTKTVPYVLGLDLGASSLGWAIGKLGGKGDARRIDHLLDAGVRIFEAGVEGDIEQGKDSSRGAQRREARQPRRQQWRRQQRQQKLFRLLQQLDLLPASNDSSSAERKETLDTLDATLRPLHIATDDHLAHQKLPYILRAAAARGPVEPHELGRALYHLGQRRGYLSNRKSQGDDDEKDGKVSQGIHEIEAAMGDLTLGQFFAESVDVFAMQSDASDHDASKGRIRKRYTSRDQFQAEFAAIKESQHGHHKQLNDDTWNQIHQAIFFQRPLKSQKHLIGRCELEPEKRRCPEALPIFQLFRLLQAVNHLRVRTVDYEVRPLLSTERDKLLAELQKQGEMKLTAARKKAGLPKGAVFTIEEWEDKIIGHRTNQKMISVFGDEWETFSPEKQDEITLEVLNYRKPQALVHRAMQVWSLDRERAEMLSSLHLEEGYGSHSKQALRKLVPLMQDGTEYATARKLAYPESFQAGEPKDTLPPVTGQGGWNADLRNPAVLRAISEVRKVVNAIIRKYGKPTYIHIEMARDLKNSRDKRMKLWADNQANQKRRERAKKEVLDAVKIGNPSRNDVDKWLLAEESNWECPYCGKQISAQSLLGSTPQFDIEHIYPRRYLDNSFGNKTLACKKCNDRKGNRTPQQAFGGEEYEAILQRVANFQGPRRFQKLERFKNTPDIDQFVTRDLNDTRYNATLAADFLGTLYGGRSDATGVKRVFTPTGGLTALIRSAWGLNGVLSGTDQKTRDDHRHHAIDAVIIALSDDKLVKRLSEAAQFTEGKTDRERAFLSGFKDPWPGFVGDVAKSIEKINVSHRTTRTIAGPLHAESIYSKAITSQGQTEYRIRKALTKLSVKEISSDQIIDPVIRRLVQEKFEELGGGLPSKVFSEESNHPVMIAKDGRSIPIHKVRIRASVTPKTIGKGARSRNVASGKDSNYASMVYAILDKQGNETKWVHEIISRLDAHERLSANKHRKGEKVLIPDEQEGKRRFKFALIKNDMLLLQGPEGEDVLYRVQKLSQNEIQLCEHTTPTISNDMRTSWNRISSIDTLQKRNARVVTVSPSGEILENSVVKGETPAVPKKRLAPPGE